MAEIVTPPFLYCGRSLPVLFLAGPIQGSENWQAKAIRIFKYIPNILIASPRRPNIRIKGDLVGSDYAEQVDWEHYYLDLSARRGATLFWLAKEKTHDCTRAYAQTTRFELGEAMARHILTGARLIVGIEEGFTNERYIRHTLQKKAPAVSICRNLQDTCLTAHALIAP